MNTVLLIAHAPLAQALREAALHVFADAAPDVLALDVPADEPPDDTLQRARALLDGRNSTLVLADVLGATPCNVATRLQQESPHTRRLLAGANLPMLLRALGYRHQPLAELAELALNGGIRGISAVTATTNH